MIGTGSGSSTLVSWVETLRGLVRGDSMIGTGAGSGAGRGTGTDTGAETGLSGWPESLTASACSVESPPSPVKVDREISENRRA